jgi:hypothetical protein
MRLTSASFLVFIVGLVSPGVLLTRHIGRPTTEQNREEIEFSGFTSYYHRSGSADKAPKMLQYFISNKLKSKAQSFAESELTLQALRNLSTRSASKRFEDISDPKKIALRCAQETEKASAYISELAIRDRTQKELQSRDYVSLMWRIDFVKPDRYHVIQKGWGGGADYFYDEWVTLGSEHYDNAGFWMKSDRTGRSKLNPRFRADKYLTILRTEEPKSAAVYHHLGRRYYLLEYESAGLGDFASFSESLIGPAHFRIWIDSETGLLAKGELAARNKEPAGKETPFELEQAFAGYGLDIQITTPQVNVQ